MHKEIKDLDLRKEDLQRELSQTRRKAERDRLDSKLQSQEALHENRRLKQEMEEVKRIHARDIEQLKDKHVTEIDQLTSRFNQSLHINAQLSRDVCHLRDIVRKAGVDVDVSSVRAAYTSSASSIVAQHLRHHSALQPINITPIESSAVL